MNVINQWTVSFQGQHKVIVLLNEPIEKEDKLKITVDKNGEHLEVSSVKRRNPYTLHFQMPGMEYLHNYTSAFVILSHCLPVKLHLFVYYEVWFVFCGIS